MEQFYEGNMTIDEQTYLVKEDGDLFNHLNLDMYAPLTECIHSDDKSHIIELISEIKESGKSGQVSVRMLCQDDSYHWFYINAEKEAFEVKGHAVFNLKFSDLNLQLRYFKNLERKSREADTYLEMLGGILLFYDRARDYLEVFVQSGKQRNVIYRGSVLSWFEEKKSTVLKRDQNSFHEFCEDMEAGRSGRYEILTNMFSERGINSLFSFTCNNVISRSQTVLGCIVPMSGNATEMFKSVDENDVGIDVLNKKAIIEYAKRAIHASNGKKIYIANIDLDDFKTINDSIGHLFGDEVLQVCSDIIKEALGQNGVLGRIGGDELMIVVDGISEYNELRNLLRNIRTNIEWAYKGKRDDVVTTCSIGAAAYPDQGDSYEEVFEVADKMLYIAKDKGKNRYVIYTPGIHDKADMDSSLSDSDTINKDALWYQLNKITVMQNLVDNYLTKKNMSNEMVLKEIAYANDLQEIIYVNEDTDSYFGWDGNTFVSRLSIHFDKEITSKLYESFDKDGMFIMNNYSHISAVCPELTAIFKDKGIQNAVYYRLANAKGFIMFARTNARHLWSDGEVLSFAVIGRCLEIGIASR